MEVLECAPRHSPASKALADRAGADGEADALALWDDNGNGRIICAEAQCPAAIPRTATCATGTATAWFASSDGRVQDRKAHSDDAALGLFVAYAAELADLVKILDTDGRHVLAVRRQELGWAEQ